MEKSKFKNLLSRYLDKKSNETESALVDAWYKSYQSKEEEIEIDAAKKEQAKRHLQTLITQSDAKKNDFWSSTFFRIAAAFIVISAISAIYFDNYSSQEKKKESYSVVSSGLQQIKKIVLPDSSVVWLNAKSNLRVSANFNEENRTVFLDEGEAYFEVTKNPEKPFIVNSPKLKVQVLGTSFNVNAYKANAYTKVSVSTGRVGVDDGEKNLAILTPSQAISYNNQTGKYQQSTVDVNHFREWREGKFYFDQASFSEVAMVLKNNFKINLKAGNSKVKDYHFTLHLSSNMPAERVLNLISAIHDSNYRKEENEMILY